MAQCQESSSLKRVEVVSSPKVVARIHIRWVLTSQPSADVSIAITVDVETTVAPTALLFTSTNWNVPQVVTITAVNDTDNEGLHSGLITHTVSSTDPNYNGISAASITVTVIDNDAPVPNVRLNEIYVNPLDIDDSREFIEIRAASDAAIGLTGLTLLMFEGMEQRLVRSI